MGRMNLKYWISRAMQARGGSFVRALGEAIKFADDDNWARIQKAFPEYMEVYMPIATAMKQEDDAKP